MISVVNGYKDGFVGEDKIYIGRYNGKLKLKASPLSNPCWISETRTRNDVIALYKSLLWKSIKAYRDNGVVGERMAELIRISKLNNVVLTCYCKPLDCHGDVVVAAINWLKNQNWFKEVA